VQSLAIINVLDEVGKTILDILYRPVLPEIDLLGLQGFDEALGHRVVVDFGPRFRLRGRTKLIDGYSYIKTPEVSVFRP